MDGLPDQSINKAPIYCVLGGEDPLTEFYEERLSEWNKYSGSVDVTVLPQVGHYFIKHQADKLSGIIQSQIEEWDAGESEGVGERGKRPLPSPILFPTPHAHPTSTYSSSSRWVNSSPPLALASPALPLASGSYSRRDKCLTSQLSPSSTGYQPCWHPHLQAQLPTGMIAEK